MKSLRCTVITPMVLLCGLVAGNASIASDSTTAPREPGVWQKHTYNFQFMGFTTTYSCDGLAYKLKVLLLAAGARSDLKSIPGACSRGYGRPDKFAQATLTFYTLSPAAGAKDAEGPRVDGAWRSIVFGTRSPRELALGDCELVEQFRNNLLPMFTARDVNSQTTCVPHQESGSNINLKFEAFAPAAVKAANAR
jgi:hypothetical protein